MEFTYRLLRYNYIYYVQGSDEKAEGLALIYAPKSATFANVRSTLILQKHKVGHEIDIESVEDLTIFW